MADRSTYNWRAESSGPEGKLVFRFKCNSRFFRFLHYLFDIKFTVNADEVRAMYNAVLFGRTKPFTETIRQEVEAVKINSYITVDVPEDILKVERVIDLRKKHANKISKK